MSNYSFFLVSILFQLTCYCYLLCLRLKDMNVWESLKGLIKRYNLSLKIQKSNVIDHVTCVLSFLWFKMVWPRSFCSKVSCGDVKLFAAVSFNRQNIFKYIHVTRLGMLIREHEWNPKRRPRPIWTFFWPLKDTTSVRAFFFFMFPQVHTERYWLTAKIMIVVPRP